MWDFFFFGFQLSDRRENFFGFQLAGRCENFFLFLLSACWQMRVFFFSLLTCEKFFGFQLSDRCEFFFFFPSLLTDVRIFFGFQLAGRCEFFFLPDVRNFWAFSLLAVNNKTLELGMWNLVERENINMYTYTVRYMVCKLTITNVATVRFFKVVSIN